MLSAASGNSQTPMGELSRAEIGMDPEEHHECRESAPELPRRITRLAISLSENFEKSTTESRHFAERFAVNDKQRHLAMGLASDIQAIYADFCTDLSHNSEFGRRFGCLHTE